MGRLRSRPKVLGPAGVVLAIVMGATLPIVLNAVGSAASLTSSGSPVAFCSPPTTTPVTTPPSTIGTTPPVAIFSPPCTPTLSASPSIDLADGQTIAVSGAGFPPFTQIGLAECAATAVNPSNCDLSNIQIVLSDGTGAFSTSFTVDRIISVNGTNTDCALSPCLLGAADISNYSVDAGAAIEFNPNLPLALTGAPATTDKVNITTGTAVITGTVSCALPTNVQVEVELMQVYHRRFNFTNYAYTSINCKGGKKATKWKVVVPPGNGYYGAGKATVQLYLSASIGNSYRNFEVSGNVVLLAKP